MEFPIRINKYLAQKGYATRVGADELISKGKVTVNGKPAVLGQQIHAEDTVHVKVPQTRHTYIAYNKPIGFVTTNPQGDEKSILKNAKIPKNLFPVGRLDKDSHGLVILTDDGRITHRLLSPDMNHEKEYVVTLSRPYSTAFIRHMQDGVMLADEKTKPAQIKTINPTTFSITLTEGKNRQIRRMTEVLGYTVTDLCRIRMQNITLGKLPVNSYREISGEEKEEFLKNLGL